MKILQSNCKKQRNIRMILLGLMLVFSISCQDRTTSRQQSDYCDFESFNHPRIFIKYKQPVNGYTVKIMWFQYGEIGNALFRLEKNGKVIPGVTDDMLSAMNSTGIISGYMEVGRVYTGKNILKNHWPIISIIVAILISIVITITR